MSGTNSTLVEKWFGQNFSKLHPLLQELHKSGGRLSGSAEINYGSGLAGLIGSRLAAKMKLPQSGVHKLQVDISHSDKALVWSRSFNGGPPVVSLFEPVGSHTDNGYWIEKSGAIRLHLTVEVIDGGWYWHCQKMSFWGIPLPLWLLPKSDAYKLIEDNRYRFSVTFTLPLIGTLVSYRGLLDAEST